MKILNSNNIIGVLIATITMITGTLVFSNLDKGFIFNDEAYYLMHFRDYKDVLTIDSTNYFRIFQFFFTQDIYKFRLITYFLLNTSTLLVYITGARFFRLNLNWLLFGLIGVCVNYITWQTSNITLSQYIGNTLLVNLALASVFFDNGNKRVIPLAITGFFMGLLLFNGIPHTSVIAAFFIYLLMVYRQEKIMWLAFLSGILLGVLFYFTFVQSFTEFISKLEYLKFYQTYHRKQHPKRFFLLWIIKIVSFIFIPAAIFWWIIRRHISKLKLLDYTLLTLAVAGILLYRWEFGAYVHYLMLLLLLIRYLLLKQQIRHKAAAIMLFVIPFCLSFGSGAYFEVRSNTYLLYFVLLLLVLSLRLYEHRAMVLFAVYMGLRAIMLPLSFSEKGWKEFAVYDQKIPINIDGHNIYLDECRARDLNDLKPYLQNQPRVIYSSNHLIGYLYILHAKPPVPYYFTLEKYIRFIIQKQGESPDKYIYIENLEYPFSSTDLAPMKFVNNPQLFKKIKTGRFTLYLPPDFKIK